jgi:ppGpp synthetase/RelA/SpoT-type nucleotidyltranferase
MPDGAKVKGRVKEVKSALGKLVRKPKYKTADRLQDGTGMRVIAKDTKMLEQSIESLKKHYKVIESDDYVTTPLQGDKGLGYRSFHAIIEDDDGLQKEIQLRTPNQNMHADWCHDVYKPVTPEQDAAMKQHADTIAQYARDMGNFFHKIDSGTKPPPPPPCPEPVQKHFTCL